MAEPLVSIDDLRRMLVGFSALQDDVSDFVNDSGYNPHSGSLGAIELAEAVDRESIFTAFSQGSLLLESAADHAHALLQILRPPVSTMAPWTLVRAGLESAALSCWLLAYDIGRRERIGRSMAFRHEDLSQQLKFARSNSNEPARQHISKQIDELEQEAIFLGYPLVHNKAGKRTGIGQRMPTATESIRMLLGTETTYRMLSGIAHSHPWALIQVGFRAPDPKVPTMLTKHLSKASAGWLLMHAADILARPVWEKTLLYGFDRQRLESLLETRYEEIGYAEARFFWRKRMSS